MRLWGSTLALGLLAASLLESDEKGTIQIVDVEAGKRFQIALPSDCFDEDGKVKLAIQVLKPAGKVARLGGRTLRDSIEVSRRRARSAPARRGRTGRAILDVTVDWSSDQVNRPLGRPLRRAAPRRAARQRFRFRGRHDGRGMRRRYRDRWEESTLNVYPSSEVINHHYDTDEELSENDVWHPRNQMRRGLGRHQGHRQGHYGGRYGGRRYYESEDESTDYRRRPRRQYHRTNAGRRSLRRRNESTTTGSDTETEEPRQFRRRREDRRVTGPVRQRFLNDFDEEIGGELVARFSLPESIFPSATPAPTRTNTRMRLRTTTLSSTITEVATIIETPVATPMFTETLMATETIAVAETTKPTTEAVSLPVIDEAEIVTFQ